MGAEDIGTGRLLLGYGLLIIPLSIIMWHRVPILWNTAVAVIRMTLQLLLVGLYLDVVFRINSFWLNAAWMIVMIIVADASIVRNSGLRLKEFALPLFVSLMVGTAVPVGYFLGPVLARPHLMDAQYAIPIAGMVLGNCLRADIIGLRSFYVSVRKRENLYLYELSRGASLREALHPFMVESLQSALSPTVATMATIGLVSLPGMMTGVILGGSSPMTAIKYQIAIMIAILAGTALTVLMTLFLTVRKCFTLMGCLKKEIFSGA